MGGWQRRGHRRRRTTRSTVSDPVALAAPVGGPACAGAYRVLGTQLRPATCQSRLNTALRALRGPKWRERLGIPVQAFDGSVSDNSFSIYQPRVGRGGAGPTVRGEFMARPEGTVIPMYGPALSRPYYTVAAVL